MTEPAPANRPKSDQCPDVIGRRVAAAGSEREVAVGGRQDLVSRVEALLFHADPIAINFETNTDEYRPEALAIVIRLPEATSAADVQRILHEEFVRWFDRDVVIARA
jgi:hypothetical protein